MIYRRRTPGPLGDIIRDRDIGGGPVGMSTRQHVGGTALIHSIVPNATVARPGEVTMWAISASQALKQ